MLLKGLWANKYQLQNITILNNIIISLVVEYVALKNGFGNSTGKNSYWLDTEKYKQVVWLVPFSSLRNKSEIFLELN